MAKDKREIIVARKGSPVVLGVGKNVVYIEDDEIITVTDKGYSITNFNNEIIDKKIKELSISLEQIEKQGFKHFMLKEIYEQGDSVKNALAGRIDL